MRVADRRQVERKMCLCCGDWLWPGNRRIDPLHGALNFCVWCVAEARATSNLPPGVSRQRTIAIMEANRRRLEEVGV